MSKWSILKEQVESKNKKSLMSSKLVDYGNWDKNKANELYLKGYRKIEISRKLKYGVDQIDKLITIETKSLLLLNIEIMYWCLESEIDRKDIQVMLNIDDFTFNRYKSIVDTELKEREENRKVIIDFYMAGYEIDVIKDILGENVLSIITNKVVKQREMLSNKFKCDIINGLSIAEICDKYKIDIDTYSRIIQK